MSKVHTINSMCSIIKELTGIKDVIPSTFPANANDECIAVSFTGGQPSKDTVIYTIMQIVCRHPHPEHAYTTAITVQDYFKKLRDVTLSSGEILVHAREGHPYPYYLGEDENRRHMYSLTLHLVLSTE